MTMAEMGVIVLVNILKHRHDLQVGEVRRAKREQNIIQEL